jgi:hypothetical protein
LEELQREVVNELNHISRKNGVIEFFTLQVTPSWVKIKCTMCKKKFPMWFTYSGENKEAPTGL